MSSQMLSCLMSNIIGSPFNPVCYQHFENLPFITYEKLNHSINLYKTIAVPANFVLPENVSLANGYTTLPKV